VLPKPQKLFNSGKEWRRYEVFSVRGLMSEFKQIKISNLKSLIVASLLLEYKEVL
jgi:hypothetical protein